MSKAIIIIDMQNDFITGTLRNKSAEAIVPSIIEELRSGNYEYAIATRDTHHSNYLNTPEGKVLPVTHCVKGTIGHDVEDSIDLVMHDIFKENCATLDKPTFGTLSLADTIDAMGPIDEVTFVGTCTDICVVSNALILKAMRPSMTINVLANCCAPLFGDPNNQKAALTVMQNCQINII